MPRPSVNNPGTITQCLQLTRTIFRKTKAWGRHDSDFPKVDFPKVQNQRVAFLLQEQAEALLAAIKTKSLQLTKKPVRRLRRSAVCFLRRRNF